MRVPTGLHRAATAPFNRLYNGGSPAIAPAWQCRLRLDFVSQEGITAKAPAGPATLVPAMHHQNEVRIKPQNLLTNFPIRRAA